MRQAMAKLRAGVREWPQTLALNHDVGIGVPFDKSFNLGAERCVFPLTDKAMQAFLLSLRKTGSVDRAAESLEYLLCLLGPLPPFQEYVEGEKTPEGRCGAKGRERNGLGNNTDGQAAASSCASGYPSSAGKAHGRQRSAGLCTMELSRRNRG